jgi:hypothetical protein
VTGCTDAAADAGGVLVDGGAVGDGGDVADGVAEDDVVAAGGGGAPVHWTSTTQAKSTPASPKPRRWGALFPPGGIAVTL